MVILNESLQIIDHSMEENIVVRNRGGGCIVKHPPLFSSDGKYIYILCGWCVSAYSVQTGDVAHHFITQNKEDLVSLATFDKYIISVSSAGSVSIWGRNVNVPKRTLKLDLFDGVAVVELHTVSSRKQDIGFNIVVAVKEKNKKGLQLLLFSGNGKFISNLYIRADEKPHTISVCDQFLAAINHDRVNVISFDESGKKNSMIAGQERWWTVVACAPEGRGFAAGDNTGRILFWPHPHLPKTRTVFHWHTLPVNAITFSASGSYMYSGGGEGVIVRWNVEVTNVRNFIPRLPAPIVHITVSPDNQNVAIATQDNGIQFLDPQNRVSAVIQKLSWGVNPVSGATLFPAGLVWDPRSRSIVLNGRPGHLQFFNTDDNKLLYNLDITGQNYLTQERHKEIINAEVTHVAISHDGKWMVTVETRDNHNTFLETLLKFWQYKFNARQFSLNTCIQLPHQGRVNKIKLQPPSTIPDHYLLVTTGTDCKFRVWMPSLLDSTYTTDKKNADEELCWICDSVGSYRSLPAECVAFSSDGSVLGVTFGASLTLWDAEISQLNTSLTRDSNVLKAVEFGSQECCHLVVTASDCHLNVWSTLTLSVIWTVPVKSDLLCVDPLSSNMALFAADNSLFVFSPSNPKPLYNKKNLCTSDNTVVNAIFVPRPHKLLDTSTVWCANSQLHFIDSNQELQYLELESELDPEQRNIRLPSTVTTGTPFSALIARDSTSNVKRAEGVNHVQFGTAADAAVRQLLSSPASTMPHIHLFCGKFLKSLVFTRKTEEENRQKEELEGVTKMEVDEDSDSDNSNNNDSDTKINQSNQVSRKNKQMKSHINSEEMEIDKSPKKEIKETISKKKPSKRQNKEKKSPKKKEILFTFDDLDTDWLSVLENR